MLTLQTYLKSSCITVVEKKVLFMLEVLVFLFFVCISYE